MRRSRVGFVKSNSLEVGIASRVTVRHRSRLQGASVIVKENCLTRLSCLMVSAACLFQALTLQTSANAQSLYIGPGGIQLNGYGPGYYNGFGYNGYGPRYRPFAPQATVYSGLGNGAYGYGDESPYYAGYRPIGWRTGPWGLGVMGYSNPYYTNADGTYGDYNYSQPIPVSSRDPKTSSANPVCVECLEGSIAAFKQSDYDASLDLINKGLVQCPGDSTMHELRALVRFAKGDYQQAASTLHSVLAVGPGWNWSTLSSLYPSVPVYTAQLRTLEAFTKGHPEDGAARFVLAYHYMSDGYPDAAAKELEMVTRLEPNDRVAAEMLKMLSKQPVEQLQQPSFDQALTTPTAKVATPRTAPTSKPIDAAMLVGTWNAARDDGSKFELIISDDATFHWKYTLKETVQEFGGTYKVAGNVLTLIRMDGGSLVAELTSDETRKFNFKLMGAPKEDPGLNFSK